MPTLHTHGSAPSPRAGMVLLGPLALFTLLVLGGCDQDLPKLSLIDEMDIFGARIEVNGEPERSTPKPGETANVELALVYPEFDATDEDLSIAVLECTFPDRFLSIPYCQEFVDFLETGAETGSEGAGDEPTPKLPELNESLSCDKDQTIIAGPFTLRCLSGKRAFDFAVAEDSQSDRRLFMGIVCRNGTAQFVSGDDAAGLGFNCDGDDADLEEEAFYLSARVQQDGQPPTPANQNPSLHDAVLKLDSKLWPAPDPEMAATTTGCTESQPAWPRIKSAKSAEIELSLPDTNRENIDKRGEATLEDLRISHGATTGEFERSASYITARREADEHGMLRTTVEWIAPDASDTSDAKQQPVHFHFAVRDGRGGFATIERFACVE